MGSSLRSDARVKSGVNRRSVSQPCPASRTATINNQQGRWRNPSARRKRPCSPRWAIGKDRTPHLAKGSRRVSLVRRRREPAPHRVLRDRSRQHELQQIIRPARLRADARQLEAAERLAIDQRAGDLAVDVKVADAEAPLDGLDVARAAREEAARQRVLRAVGDFQGMLQIARL